MLNLVHSASARDVPLTDIERRRVFEAHFLHEQDTVVSDTLRRATTALNWPLVKFLALRPPIRFAFLPDQKQIRFHNFADKAERVKNGLRAFDYGAFVGWQRVEQSLDDYGLLSNSFFVNPIKDFQQMRVENSDGRRARSRNWAINFDRRVIARLVVRENRLALGSFMASSPQPRDAIVR